jgi:hypothetical protein
MGIAGGPNIIEDGLVLALDAASTYLPVNRNLLTYTNDLTNAAWAKVRSQITASAAIAPDGTNTAFAMTITDATGLVRLSQLPVNTSIIGGPYTFSVYVKQNNISASLFDTGIYNAASNSGSEPSYNILNNFVATGGNGVWVSNRTVTSVGNGWYRVATTATIPNINSWYLFFDIEAGSGTKTNGQSLYLWGPQFEYGNVATEYQPVNTTTRLLPDQVNLSISGSLINNPTFNGSNGGSIVFDGINDYISINSIDLSNTNKITICFFCKILNYREVVNGNNVVLELSTNFNSKTTGLYVGFADDSNTLFSTTFPISINLKGDIGYNISGFNKNLVNDLNWHYWTCIFDKSQTETNPQETFLYIDGIYQSPTIIPSTIYRSNNTNNFGNEPLFIGSRSGGSVGPSNIQIANIQIYNRTLSPAEIQQNYNAQKSRFNL